MFPRTDCTNLFDMKEFILSYFSSADIFTILELITLVVGFFYVFLEIKKSHYLWYFCLVAAITSIFVYYHNNYMAMLLLQIYYIISAFYGLSEYRKIKAKAIEEFGFDEGPKRTKVAIARFNWSTGLTAAAIAVVAYMILVPVLFRYSESQGTLKYPMQPYLDAFTAVGSMLGTYYLTKSYMCQWYLWLVLDSVSVVMFAISGMYPMMVLYISYVVMSAMGLANWKKNGVYV